MAKSSQSLKPTESELEILQVLWQRGQATVREVHEELSTTKDAGYTTTLKLMQIMNEKGLHARASAKFVEVVEEFDAQAQVTRDGMSVSGDSIMGLLMLAASRGTTIVVETSGAQAEALAAALAALVADGFGEDR